MLPSRQKDSAGDNPQASTPEASHSETETTFEVFIGLALLRD